MKKIKTVEATGKILSYDITKITTDEIKVAFKKGHIIKDDDIQELLNIGQDYIFIWEDKEGYVNQEDGYDRIKKLLCGNEVISGIATANMMKLFAREAGLLHINLDNLNFINNIDNIFVSVLKNRTKIYKNDVIGAIKIIPLQIEEKLIIDAEKIIKKPILNIKAFKKKTVGVIVTGNEIFYGRIEDKFNSILNKKFAEYDCKILNRSYLKSNAESIRKEILTLVYEGIDIIICTGGMGLEPDDVTAEAIISTGSSVVSYGTPVFPGLMLMLAYYINIPIIGLPADTIYYKDTVFDNILAMIVSEERITKDMIIEMANGGYIDVD